MTEEAPIYQPLTQRELFLRTAAVDVAALAEHLGVSKGHVYAVLANPKVGSARLRERINQTLQVQLLPEGEIELTEGDTG